MSYTSRVLTRLAQTGKPCTADHSLCNGRNELCIGRGPEYDADDHGYKSNLVIAGKQFNKAQDLWQGKSAKIAGTSPCQTFWIVNIYDTRGGGGGGGGGMVLAALMHDCKVAAFRFSDEFCSSLKEFALKSLLSPMSAS